MPSTTYCLPLTALTLWLTQPDRQPARQTASRPDRQAGSLAVALMSNSLTSSARHSSTKAELSDKSSDPSDKSDRTRARSKNGRCSAQIG
jgi:hypothetical protein